MMQLSRSWEAGAGARARAAAWGGVGGSGVSFSLVIR